MGRAVTNLRQNWLISSITIGIISICLFLVGGYLLVTHNLQGVFETWKNQVTVTIYLRDGWANPMRVNRGRQPRAGSGSCSPTPTQFTRREVRPLP